MNFEKMTIKQLKEFATQNGICLAGYTLKAHIITVIEREYKRILKNKEVANITENKDIEDPSYIINCFLNLSGKKLKKALDINDNIYFNKSIGKKWYYNLSKKIHPDTCKLENANTAFEKLNKYYIDFIK